MSTSGIVDPSSTPLERHPAVRLVRHLLISIVGETNRAPFDLPEAESELVGGFHTEYSSFKFAMFFLAEYINMVTVSALATTLFLGGWRAPWPLSLWAGANSGWWPVLWFTGKVVVFLFVFVWLRGTLPRLRYDQFMSLGWKWLIPINLLWIMATATVQTLKNEGVAWYVAGLVWRPAGHLPHLGDVGVRDGPGEEAGGLRRRRRSRRPGWAPLPDPADGPGVPVAATGERGRDRSGFDNRTDLD